MAPLQLPARLPIPAAGSQQGREKVASLRPAMCSFSTPVACPRLYPTHGSAPDSLNQSVSTSPPESLSLALRHGPQGSLHDPIDLCRLTGSSSLLAPLQSRGGQAPPGVRSSWHVSRRPLAGRGVEPTASNWKTAHGDDLVSRKILSRALWEWHRA